MSRRERLERRAEKRRDWAASRERKSAAGFARARTIADGIPLGQPILVGHHSERHHRADIARIDAGMRQGCESAAMAKGHESKAAGIEAQLAGSIFSDDPDAVEALEAKAAGIEAEADRCKAVNTAHRKAPGETPEAKLLNLAHDTPAGLLVPPLTDAEARAILRLWQACPYHRAKPHPAYHLTSLRANARRCRERVKSIRAQAAQTAKAEASGGTLVELVGVDHARVTFEDYPGREVVAALKAAGFHWSRPSWYGKASALPEDLRDLMPAAPQAATEPPQADNVCPDGPGCLDPACIEARQGGAS